MEAVHRAKLLLLLADFSGVKSAVPAIVARYKVQPEFMTMLYKHRCNCGMCQDGVQA